MLEKIQPFKIINQQIESIVRDGIEILPNLTAATVFLILVWIARKFILASVRRLLERAHARPELVNAVLTLTSVAIWVVGILISATIALPSLTPVRLLAGVGFISIALGLAFKDIFENFLAGILILVRKKMRIGDIIDCKEVTGQVESINIRETFVRQVDRTLIIVPNSFIYQNPCRIITDESSRLVTVTATAASGLELDTIQTEIANSLRDLSSVKKEMPIDVSVKEFSPAGAEVFISWMTGSRPSETQVSKEQVLKALRKIENIVSCK